MGKIKSGDILVSLLERAPYRKYGDMFLTPKKQDENSLKNYVYYLPRTSAKTNTFRYATPEEIAAYNQGIRNINDTKELIYEIY